jgi:hypothetical protein
MSLENTTEDLIQQVRDITDEDNTTDITSELILRMLNRSQQDLVRELTKKMNTHYMQELYYTPSDFSTDSQGISRVLQLPKQAYCFRVHNVDAKIGSVWYPVKNVPAINSLGFDMTNQSSLPVIYRIQGDKMYVYPDAAGATSFRIRYSFRAPKLVTTEGRITNFSSANNTITVDSIGTNLSTSVDTLAAFINVIDSLTGAIKATLQVSGIDSTNKILTIKSNSLSRSTVFGYTVGSSLPTDIALDDYVCLASGTCVPYLIMDLSNYHIELAAFFVKRAVGTVETADFSERDEVKKAASSFWTGRDMSMRVQRRKKLRHPFLFFRGR